MHELERARNALWSIPCPDDHDSWWPIIGSAISEGIDEGEILRWCENGPNFDRGKVLSKIKSLSRRPDTGRRGSLFKAARNHGWRESTNGRRHEPRQKPQEPRKASGEGQRPSFDVAAVWDACEPATVDHEYIARKLGLPDGLRVVPDTATMRIAGQCVAGWLAVPMFDGSSDEPASLQFIPPGAAGKKLNLPGHPVAGWFTVGPPPAGRVFVCEGLGQAWSAHQATQAPAVVAFGSGRMEAVARALQARGAVPVLVADMGTEAKIEQAAQALGCAWVGMPEGSPGNFDLNDVHARDGMSAVADLLAQAREPEAPQPQRFRFQTIDEMLREPFTGWRVRDLIPERGLVVVWGASGSGKTFAVLDMAAAIARGLPWCGRRTKRGAVAYIAAEGNLRSRGEAYMHHNGLTGADLSGLRVLNSSVDLLDPSADVEPLIADLRLLARETGGLAIVIIDTLNRVMPGGDENSSQDMGAVIGAAKRIEQEIGCAVLFVHHSGKDESKGSRGHSSLKAATDAEISVRRDGDIRTITAEKVRDGEDGATLLTFRLLPVDLGPLSDVDPDAEPDERRTSCVVAPAAGEATHKPTAPAGGNQRIAWDRIGELLRQAGDVRPDGAPDEIPAGRPAITLEAAADAVASRLVCEQKRRRERAIEAVRGLVGRGLLCHAEGWIWCA